MRTEQLDDGSWVSFPSLFQEDDGSWVNMSNEDDWMFTYNEAARRGEVIEFGDNKEEALAYGEGSWKTAAQPEGGTGPTGLSGVTGAQGVTGAVGAGDIPSPNTEAVELENYMKSLGYTPEGLPIGATGATGATGVDGFQGPPDLPIIGLNDSEFDGPDILGGDMGLGVEGAPGVGGQLGVAPGKMPTPKEIAFNKTYGDEINPQQAIEAYMDFSKQGSQSPMSLLLGYNTLEDYYTSNPMHRVASGKLGLGDITENLSASYPDFNEVGLINPRYKNFNYDIQNYSNLNRDQATFLIDQEVGDFATINGNLSSGLFKDQEDLLKTAGLYKLRNNIGYQINRINDVNNQIYFDPKLQIDLTFDELSSDKQEKLMQNTQEAFMLGSDWDIVNSEWASMSEPNNRVYDPESGVIIGNYDKMAPGEKAFNLIQDDQAKEYTKSYGPEQLIALERDIYFQLMNVAKKIKANPEKEVDRNTMQVIQEFLGSLTFTDYETRRKNLSENPSVATVDTPTDEVIALFPDNNNMHLRAGLPFLSSNTESAQLYNELRYELDAVHRAIVLNEDPTKSNRYVDAGLMQASIGAPGKEREASDVVSVDGYNILGDYFPNFDRAVSRSGQGFIGGFYGTGVGEEVYSPIGIGRGDYYTRALQAGGFEGPEMERQIAATQYDAYDDYGILTGTLGEFILELRGGSGLLKLPSTIKGGAAAYKAGLTGDLAFKSQKAKSIFDGARTYIAKSKNINPFLAGSLDVGLVGLSEASAVGTAGVAFDKKVGAGEMYDPYMFGAFGMASRGIGIVGEVMQGTKVHQRINQGIQTFNETKLGRFTPTSTLLSVGEDVVHAGAGTGTMFAVEYFQDLFTDGGGINTQMYVESLPNEEMKNEAKAQTMFWFLLTNRMISSKTGEALMHDIYKFKYGVPKFNKFFRINKFFRSQEAYNNWESNRNNPQESTKLLKEGFEDIMQNGSAAEKQAAAQESQVIVANNHLSQTKKAIEKLQTNKNNSVKSQNSVNELSVNPQSVSTVGDANGISTILAVTTVPGEGITSTAVSNVDNNITPQGNTQEAINVIQQIKAEDAKNKEAIPNTVQRAEYTQASLAEKDLQRELDKLNDPDKTPAQNSPNIIKRKEELTNELTKIKSLKEEIASREETELEFITNLINVKERRNVEMVDNAQALSEKYPRLTQIVNELAAQGVENPQLQGLRKYRDEISQGKSTTAEGVTPTEEPVLEAEVVAESAPGFEILEEDLTVYKGTGGKTNEDGSVRTRHPNVKGKFYSEDITTAQKYAGEEGIISEDIPKGSKVATVEIDGSKYSPGKAYDDAETEAINKAFEEGADVVKLNTVDQNGGKQTQIITKPATEEVVQEVVQEPAPQEITIKDKQDAVQVTSAEAIPAQEPPADSPTMGESVPEPTKPTEEVEVQEEVKVEPEAKTVQEEVVAEAEIKEPREPGKIEEPPKRQYKIDKDLDEIVASGTKGEKLYKENLKAKGYTDRQADLAINRKDKEALVELNNLKKDLKRQADATEKYSVKATDEFKETLNNIINSMAKDKNIKFTKGQLKNILNAATGKEMNYLEVDKAIDKAIVEVEKSVRKAYIEDIKTNSRKEAVESAKKKGKDRGKISITARRLWNDFTNTYQVEDLKNMSISELEAIDDQLNSILEQGRLDARGLKRIRTAQIQSQKGEIDQGLYRNAPSKDLNTYEETEAFLAENRNNFVIVNGKEINGVEPLKEYVKANPFETLSGGKGYTAPTKSEVSQDQKTSRTRKFIKGYETIDNMTQKLKRVGGPKVKKSIDNLTDKVVDAKYNYIVGQYTMVPKLQQTMVKSGVSQRYLTKDSGIKVGGSKKDLSNGQVAHLYMMNQVNGPQSLRNSNVDPDAVTAYVENDPKLKDLVENMYQFYEEAELRYGDFAESITGVPLKDPNSTTRYASTARDVKEPDQIDLFNPDGSYSGLDVISGHIKPKTDKDGPLKLIDIMENAANYVDGMERTMAFYPAAEEYSAVFNNNTVGRMQQLLGKYGAQDLSRIMETFDEAISGTSRSGNRYMSEGGERALRGINRFGVISTLALKPAIFSKQLLSGMHYAPMVVTDPKFDIGYKDIIRSSVKLLSPNAKAPSNKEDVDNDVHFLRSFMGHPMFKDRWNRTGIDPTLAGYRDIRTSSTGAKVRENLIDVLMIGTKTGDMGGVFGGVTTAYALYESNLAKGMDRNSAFDRTMKDYLKLTDKFQQTDNPLYSPAYAKNPIGAFVSPYTSAQNALVNEAVTSAKKFRDFNNYSTKDKFNQLRRGLYAFVVPSLVYNLVGSDYREEGEELKRMKETTLATINEGQMEKDRNYGLLMNTLQGAAQGFGIPGRGLDYGINYMRGRPTSFSMPPVMSEIMKIYDATDQVIDILSGDVEYDNLDPKQKKAIDVVLGNIDNLILEDVPQLMSGEITAGDFMLGQDKDFGKGRKGFKLKRYGDDEIRNWWFGLGNALPESTSKSGSEFSKGQGEFSKGKSEFSKGKSEFGAKREF